MKKILFILIGLFLILQIASYSLLLTGNYFLNRNAKSRATKLYNLSYWSSLTLNQKAKSLSSNIGVSQNSNPSKPSKVVYNIDNSKVSVTGKRIVRHNSTYGQEIALTAILKNNAEVGIPNVKITKIVIYDDKNNIVATKQDYNKEIAITYQGEYPFSLLLDLNKSEIINANNFDIEFVIPPFSLNEKVVRLDVLSQKMVSVKTDGGDGLKSFQYVYRVLLANNTDKEIGNIRRTSFLKHKDVTLTRIGEACCPPVNFEIKSNNEILSLDSKKYVDTLKPQEQREYEFKINSDVSLYDTDINPANIQLISYFVGVIQ